MAVQRVEIPYAPRVWAKPFHAAFQRWLVLVLHRRAGKTTSILNHHQRAAMDHAWERGRLRSLLPQASDAEITKLLYKRVYWHVMPSYHQAKLTGAWELAKEIARPIPGVQFNESELLVKYPNTGHGEARLQLIGADKPDSLRGPGLSGLSLDEYSQIPTNAFSEVLSKSLADHLGYCIFSGTIKGHDHLYRTYEAAGDDPDWFRLWQDVDVSLNTETGPTITALTRAMEDDRKLVLKGVMTQAEFDQEWYLSPEAAIKGAIYQAELALARSERRIMRVPYEETMPVETWWDIGVLDPTAIWFTQTPRLGGEVRVIDYYECNGVGLPHYAQVLKDKGYTYKTHWAPHDIQVKEYASGRSRIEAAAELGITFEVVPNVPIDDGINAAKLLFRRCWFDAEKTAVGVEALAHYRRKYNTNLKEFTNVPVHDMYSHGADAFRYLAVCHKPPEEEQPYTAPPRFSASGQGWMGI